MGEERERNDSKRYLIILGGVYTSFDYVEKRGIVSVN